MPLTILLTGFGPFPGAPFNPTGLLVTHLAHIQRPAFSGVRRIAHIFPTSYAAVDRELPRLIAAHRPDAILMFGLATRSPCVRIEMRARNSVSPLLVDVAQSRSLATCIAPQAPASLALRAPRMQLLAAVRDCRVPVVLSRDAGRYLCNYLYWRGLEAAATHRGPVVAAFVHVPSVRRAPVPRIGRKRRTLTLDDLARAGERVLRTAIAAARDQRRHSRSRSAQGS
jgi:pyroglutamyl-peptidase